MSKDVSASRDLENATSISPVFTDDTKIQPTSDNYTEGCGTSSIGDLPTVGIWSGLINKADYLVDRVFDIIMPIKAVAAEVEVGGVAAHNLNIEGIDKSDLDKEILEQQYSTAKEVIVTLRSDLHLNVKDKDKENAVSLESSEDPLGQESQFICLEPSDFNCKLRVHAKTQGLDDTGLQQILYSVVAEDLVSNLNIDSISYLEQIFNKTSDKYDDNLSGYLIRILTQYAISQASGPSHTDSLINLVKKENTDEEVSRSIIGEFASNLNENLCNEQGCDPILGYLAELLPEDISSRSHKFTEKLIDVLSTAHEKYNLVIENVDILFYFNEILSSGYYGENNRRQEKKKIIDIISNSLERKLIKLNVAKNQNLAKKIEHLTQELFSKTEVLPPRLLKAIFKVYERNQSYFTDLVNDILSDKALSIRLLNKYIHIIKIVDPWLSLSLALRLIQYRGTLPIDILEHFMQFLSDHQSIGIIDLAINVYHKVINKHIAEELSKLANILIEILPKANVRQQIKINDILDNFSLAEEQELDLSIQKQIVSWHSMYSISEKVVFGNQLVEKINVKNHRLFLPFLKALLVTQNSVLVSIADEGFSRIKKHHSLTWNKEERQALNLFGYQQNIFSLLYNYFFRAKYEIVSCGGLLIVGSQQWKNIQLHFRKRSWLDKYIKQIGFVGVEELNNLLFFIKENNLQENELIKALSYTAGIVSSVIDLYANLLDSYLEDIIDEFSLLPIVMQEGLKPIYPKIKDAVIKLHKKLNWPAEFLFSFLREKEHEVIDDVIKRILALDILADYEVTPEVSDRNGNTVFDILSKPFAQETVWELNSLIFADNRIFVEKGLEVLLAEIAKENPKNHKIVELIESGYLRESIIQIEKIIEKDWLGYKYVVKDEPVPSIISEGYIYIYKKNTATLTPRSSVSQDQIESSIQNKICLATKWGEKCLGENKTYNKLSGILRTKDLTNPFIYEQASQLDIAPELAGITKPAFQWQKEEVEKWLKTIPRLEIEYGKSIGEVYSKYLPEMLGILSIFVCNKIFNGRSYPYTVQHLTALIQLHFPYGAVAGVTSGGGKSIIITLVNAILSITGINPDTITSNGELAKRDAKKHQEFYESLGISVGNNVNYKRDGTEANNPYLKNVVYADLKNIIGDYLRDLKDDIRSGRRLIALTLDEMDSSVIDGTGKMIQLAEHIQRLEQLRPLIIYIWGAVKAAISTLRVKDGVFSIIKGVESSEEKQQNIIEEKGMYFSVIKIGTDFSSVLNVITTTVTNQTLHDYFALDKHPDDRKYFIPKEKLTFAKDQLPNWILASAITQLTYRKDIQYTIDVDDSGKNKHDRVVLVDANSGEHHRDMRIADGVHQNIQLDNSLAIETESLNTDSMAYQTFIGLYRYIFGYTATPGDKENHNFFLQHFNIDTFVMPTFSHKDLYEHKNFVADNIEKWNYKAFAYLYTKCLSRDRACLVILDNINQVKNFYEHLEQHGIDNKYVYGVSTNDPREFDIKKRLKPRDIVIATPLASRGADPLLTPEVIKNGGLFALITTPYDDRHEIQEKNRPARNGEPGSVMGSVIREELVTKANKYEDIVQENRELRNRELIQNRQRVHPSTIVTDKVFFAHILSMRDLNSPINYRLLIGKPDENTVFKPFSLYLFKDAERIMLAATKAKEKEQEYIDLTEPIDAVDSEAKKHIASFLSNIREIVLPLNHQDDEIIRFIAAYKGYTNGVDFYDQVVEKFNQETWQGHLELLLKKDDFKDLQHPDKQINRQLLEKVRIRRLYQIWKELRSKRKLPAICKQYRENYAYFHRKELDPLMKAVYGDEDINIATQEYLDKFYKFDQDFFANKDDEYIIKNPAYLDLEAWETLPDNHELALAKAKKARKIEENWITTSVDANIYLVTKGFGILEDTAENQQIFADIKSHYSQMMSSGSKDLERKSGIEYRSLVTMKTHGSAVDKSSLFKQWLAEYALLKHLNKVNERNQEVIFGEANAANMGIRVKNVQRLADYAKSIDIAATAASLGLEQLQDVAGDLDSDGLLQPLIDQMASSGAMIIEIEAYKLEPPSKDWLTTIVSCLAAVAFIVAGTLMPAGSVFFGMITKSLISKGIGDIISAVISVITNFPLVFNQYFKSTLISLAVVATVATIAQIADKMATNGLRMFDKMANRVMKNGVLEKIDTSTVDRMKDIALESSKQIVAESVSYFAYDNIGRKTINFEDIKKTVIEAYDKDIISNETIYNLLKTLLVTDRFYGNDKLQSSLKNKITDIANNYVEDFQGNGAIFATELVKNIASGMAGIFSPIPVVSSSNIVSKGTDFAIALVKYQEATLTLI